MRLNVLQEKPVPVALVMIILALLAWQHYGNRLSVPSQEIHHAVDSYVKALYSRDFASAYRWISARDQDAKSADVYVKEQGSFAGFTRQLAGKLAGHIEVAGQPVISGGRATVVVNLTLPDVEKLAPLVLNWDEEKLNALSPAAQNALLATVDERKRQNAIPFTQTKESFELVNENNEWKIFVNWRSGVQVDVQLKLPDGVPLEVAAVNPTIRFQPGEPFTIRLRLKNPTEKELRARVMHNVEPKTLEKYLGVGDCGTFVPFRLAAGKADENNTTFLVWTNLPAEIKRFTMIYDFEVDKQSP
ncbi:MAG: cytochrome c oxidase assembly protein [Candidatus Binatia bacterium]